MKTENQVLAGIAEKKWQVMAQFVLQSIVSRTRAKANEPMADLLMHYNRLANIAQTGALSD